MICLSSISYKRNFVGFIILSVDTNKYILLDAVIVILLLKVVAVVLVIAVIVR